MAVVALAAQVAALADDPRIVIETSMGPLVIEVYPAKAPHTVMHFLTLVDNGYYDGLIFHRVLAGFVIQTGGFDLEMNRREGPETIVNESFNGLYNSKLSVAMARAEDPDSANAQFFINMNDNVHLDAQSGAAGYTVFGRLIAGADVAESIELSDTELRNGMVGMPVEPIIVLKARRQKTQQPD